MIDSHYAILFVMSIAICYGWKLAPPTTQAFADTRPIAQSRFVPRGLTLGMWSPPERHALFTVMREKRITSAGTRVQCPYLAKIFTKEISAGMTKSAHLAKNKNCD
jgi:hypothetical protein